MANEPKDQDQDEEVPPAPPGQPPGGADRAAMSTVEAWAEKKGMYPQFLSSNTAGQPNKNPEFWKFASAKAAMGWAEGALVTEEEFDKAIAQQGKHEIR